MITMWIGVGIILTVIIIDKFGDDNDDDFYEMIKCKGLSLA